MTHSEVEAGSGESLACEGRGVEMKSAMTGFLREFSAFQSEIKSRFKEQEDRIALLKMKSVATDRPALSRQADHEAPHRKAFSAYLRQGEDDGLRHLQIEEKALSTAVLGDGGFLVDRAMSDTINTVLRGASSIRAIANVVTVESSVYDVLIDSTDIGSGWADEATATVETSTPQIERISIPLHELSAMPKASQRLLDDTAFDVESWLAERIADRFARAEGLALVSGNGNGRPRGFLNYPAVANGAWTWGRIGYVPTGQAADFNPAAPADAIVDLVYALNARYRQRATFVMNSKTAGAVRKMKDADGRFLWVDSLAAAEPARLMGYRVLISEDMPDIAANAFAIAFGDFQSGYTIAERPDLRILRDPFSAKPNVLFYATKRVGGDVSDFAALKLLRFALT